MSHAFEPSEPVDATLPVVPSEAVSSGPPVPSPRPVAPVRDEAEPVIEYDWSESDERIRAAAKAYLENTHADY